jgi:hypothetical protein
MAVQVKVYSPKLRKITHRECLRAISSFSQKINMSFYVITHTLPLPVRQLTRLQLVKKKPSAIYYQA